MKKIETIVPYNQNVPLHIGAFIEAIKNLNSPITNAHVFIDNFFQIECITNT